MNQHHEPSCSPIPTSPLPPDRGPRRIGSSPILAGLCLMLVGAGVVSLKVLGGAKPQASNGGVIAAPTPRPAVVQKPAAVAAALEAARKYIGSSETGKAQAVLRGAIEQFPEDQELRTSLADVLVITGDFPGAYAELEAALAIGPREATIEFKAGTVASKLGQTGRSVEHYTAAQVADTSNPKYPLYLAQVQLGAGLTDEARANLMLSAKLDPGQHMAWGTLAQLALKENKLSVAQQYVSKARELEPGNAGWIELEARVHKREGDPDRALLLLASLAPEEQNKPSTLRMMAECYGLLNRPADALALYEAAMPSIEHDADAVFDAVAWCERVDKIERARELAHRAAQLGSESAGEWLRKHPAGG